MNVLMLNYEYPPIGGGTGNANRYLLEEFSGNEELEIDLVTSSGSDYREEEFSDNIDIYRVDVGKKEMHHWRQSEILRYMWRGLGKARELAEEKEYDLVHAWTGFPCGLMARFLGLPYIVALRGSDVPGYSERFSLQYFFLKPLVRNVWRNAEKVVPNSRDLKELAQETMDIEMEVVPNGIDTEEFSPDFESQGEELEVLVVSRLTARKRVRDVIEAVASLKDIRLKVLGDGPRRQELEELVEKKGLGERVEMPGRVPHEELPRHYREADVFVLPSLNEGMSNALLEALSSGLPVIVTDTGGAERLVDGNGEVVPEKDPGAIRDALERYMEEPERAVGHGRKSRQKAEKRGWNQVADQYFKTYREIA